MLSDTSLIAAPRPFVKEPVARSNRPIENVLVHVHETKITISGQTAPRKLTYPSRRKFTHNPCKGIAGLAVLQTSRADYKKSLLAFFWRASIASMYGIGP
jgi:hypothetical protein